ncbi:mitogen-activated protein kinase kinase kinase 7 [Frankliniella occidentalis]|nr:mitogen-activated protein kinase kinase kinase 7 [Frankliniella occidentalis]
MVTPTHGEPQRKCSSATLCGKDRLQRNSIFKGKGSFGVVYKGIWRGNTVAVKRIETESERKAFMVEVHQLSRVSHKNIVKLYGAYIDEQQNPGLVMEFAEGGSLYNVLHGRSQKRYTAGHAISWALQDLKSPNLLLVAGGELLKICDFGTACVKSTYMTNNKGSAAWMAPEVFEGTNKNYHWSQYTEKCDVYSWGIILWEVLSRRKPFSESGNAFRILWEVYKGIRPPRIQNCPKPVEDIMTRCWDKDPNLRPPMDDVVNYMSKLIDLFGNYNTPIEKLAEQEPIEENDEEDDAYISSSHTGDSSTYSANGLTNGTGQRREPVMPRTGDPSSFPPLTLDVDPVPEGPKLSIAPHNPSNGQGPPLDHPSSQCGGQEEVDNVHLMLDNQLRPVEPVASCQQSLQIFTEHKQLAQEYLTVQTQMAYLSKYKMDLMEKLSEAEGLSQLDQQDTEQQQELLRKLTNEKENLVQLHQNLNRQLDLIRRRQGGSQEDGWVVVPHQEPAA